MVVVNKSRSDILHSIGNDNNSNCSTSDHDNIRLMQLPAEEHQHRPTWSSVGSSNDKCQDNDDITYYTKQRRSSLTVKTLSRIPCIVFFLSCSLLFPDIQRMGGILVLAGNYNGYYYNYYNNNNGNGNNNYGNYNGYYNDDKVADAANDDGNSANDDGNNNANDDGGNNAAAAATDDANNNQDDTVADGDDLVQEESYSAAQQGEDDYYAADDAAADMGDDNAYLNEDMSYQQSYQLADDDVFHWNENVGFSGVSILPLSCVN
jgi:hypothetical protein